MIVADPPVLGGQADLAGTRVPVGVVLDCLAAGMTVAEIVGEYPSATETGVRPAAAYGAVLARDELVPLPTEWGSSSPRTSPRSVLGLLVAAGHDADAVVSEGRPGSEDTLVGGPLLRQVDCWSLWTAGSATYVTSRPAATPGIIVLRAEEQWAPASGELCTPSSPRTTWTRWSVPSASPNADCCAFVAEHRAPGRVLPSARAPSPAADY